MNRIDGTVEAIEAGDIVTYVRVHSGDATLCLIKSKVPRWLGVGDRVNCTFQEASVCVSKECPGKVSIVRRGDSLCELTFESGIGRVVSLITARAYESLGLEEGCNATMLLRGVDIHLEPRLSPVDVGAYRELAARTEDA